MNTKAIVTLAVGESFKSHWEKVCRKNWETYAKKHGCDLIVIDHSLDDSEKALRRSPAWQKCLILNDSAVRNYDQVAWIDCDILFNPAAPDVFHDVPLEKVGAVNSFSDPTSEENQVALQRFWNIHRSVSNIAALGEYEKPEDVYLQYGPPVEPLSAMLNAGVLVASPKHHAEVWRFVYENYDDRGQHTYYENVPLSYELIKGDWIHWLDPKFNHIWAWSKMLHYPFLQESSPRTLADKILRRVATWSGNNYERRVSVLCATSALLNCHFLHFAGCPKEMELVDLEMAGRGGVRNLGV